MQIETLDIRAQDYSFDCYTVISLNVMFMISNAQWCTGYYIIAELF